MDFEQQILVQNRNIIFNILSCLKFKQRYNLCLTTIELFNNVFKIYKHEEKINIEFKNYSLTKIWNNIKFKMNIYNTHLKDVSMLNNIFILNLSSCINITDVSMLGNVYDLNLSWCDGITDVSSLNNVYKLNLTCCIYIKDVSMLKNVNTLNLIGCKNIPKKQIEELKKTVKILYFIN
jgi:hypothetical protein